MNFKCNDLKEILTESNRKVYFDLEETLPERVIILYVILATMYVHRRPAKLPVPRLDAS